MPIVKGLKRAIGKLTGIARRRTRVGEQLAISSPPQVVWLREDARTPNNPKLPLVIYRHAVRLGPGHDPAAVLEALFARHGWRDAWRNGVHDFLHFHTGTHEVLGIARGRVTMQFGGAAGPKMALAAGDVAVLPAGTGRRRMRASRDLLVVCAYPDGGRYDEPQPRADRAGAGTAVDREGRSAAAGSCLWSRWAADVAMEARAHAAATATRPLAAVATPSRQHCQKDPAVKMIPHFCPISSVVQSDPVAGNAPARVAFSVRSRRTGSGDWHEAQCRGVGGNRACRRCGECLRADAIARAVPRAAPQVAAAEQTPAPARVPAKEAFTVRQPPVPLLFKPRPPVDLPSFETESAPPEPVEAADAMDGAAAKAAVEADGYRGVKVLGRGGDGLWHAEGLRGSTMVLLTVNSQGTVTSQ